MSLHDRCKIQVYSEGEGRGTTLSLYIPLLKPDPSEGSADCEDSSRSPGGMSWWLCCGRRGSHKYHSRTRVAVSSAAADPSPTALGARDRSMTATIITSQNAPASHIPMPARAAVAVKDLTILVVDDSVVNRRMLIRLLNRSAIGGSIEEAVDGLDFLKKMGLVEPRVHVSSSSSPLSLSDPGSVQRQGNSGELSSGGESLAARYDVDPDQGLGSFDLCIVDKNMPHLMGDVAVARLRDLGYTGLIVGLTGDGGDDDIASYREHGADFVILKPMKIQELVGIVNSQFHSSGLT